MKDMTEVDARWHALSAEVIGGMEGWRQQHPKASLDEIECALDERLARLRAQMLQDTALLSAAADVSAVAVDERPLCPHCGARVEARGQQSRTLTTHHEQALELKRSYVVCPECQTGFFPPG
jgi:hypothetical protein